MAPDLNNLTKKESELLWDILGKHRTSLLDAVDLLINSDEPEWQDLGLKIFKHNEDRLLRSTFPQLDNLN